MKYCFFKGWHYAFPFEIPCLISHYKPHEFNYVVCFDESIRYELPGDDQHDVNKLLGVSYGFHHQNSDRIGFRYNPKIDAVELCKYCYVDGKRIPTEVLYTCKIGEKVTITTMHTNIEGIRCFGVVFNDDINYLYQFTMENKWYKMFGYTLSLYFGGNNPAPQTIYISKKKTK